MTSKSVELAEEPNFSSSTPGALLRQRREKIGYSMEAVANQLHLRVQIIESLECDDYSKMPEIVFVKGYLRAYAKLLNLGADEMILLFNNHLSEVISDDKSEGVLWQNQKQFKKNSHWLRYSTLGVALLALILIALWWHNNSAKNWTFDKVSNKAEPVSNEKISLPGMDTLHEVKLAENKEISIDKKPRDKKVRK